MEFIERDLLYLNNLWKRAELLLKKSGMLFYTTRKTIGQNSPISFWEQKKQQKI